LDGNVSKEVGGRPATTKGGIMECAKGEGQERAFRSVTGRHILKKTLAKNAYQNEKASPPARGKEGPRVRSS